MNNIVLPDYENCILNTISSILKNYNVKTKYDGLKSLDNVLNRNYKNVVFMILDGMGEHILNNISPKGFFKEHEKQIITSVYPSTTTAAMTTYYSGRPPIETGWIAMSQYFKEYGRSMEMMREIDSYTKEKYSDAQIDVFNDVVGYKTIYEQIEEASPDVKAYEISPAYCKIRSKRSCNADNIHLICNAIESICTNSDKNFILSYIEKPDTLLHKYGCNSKEVKDFVLEAEKEIEIMCNNLKDTNTLIIVSADHGHKDINKVYTIADMDDIQECLYLPTSLESRVPTFWVKDDKKKEFERLFKHYFDGEFLLYTKEEFLEKHFLGYGNEHSKIDEFIGNYIALSISDSIIKLGTKLTRPKPDKKSTHCGLTPDEMEVPLIVIE